MKEKSREDMINSVIGQGSVLKGTAEIQGSIRIDGEVEGNLTVTEMLVVGKSGVVRADVKAKSMIVGGRVFGNVSASKRVELEAGCHMEGDVTTTSLVIAEGVFFQGSCRMNGDPAKSGDAPQAARIPEETKVSG
ncbi:MAG: polymer-forming cytoskeletal protein [Candidatus Eisenbacteria sp.]|nr:polymer-forming cytoskeletal protein [Candidatus Eisenbacteria bacterium]